MQISVTQKHIDEGIRSACTRCPVALAIRDAFKTDYVHVASDIDIGRKPEELRIRNYPSPPEVVSFITAFDNGQPVKPFTFEMEVVCPTS